MRWLGVLTLLAACGLAKTPPGEPDRPRGVDPRISAPEPTEDDTLEEPVVRRPAPVVEVAEEAAEAPAEPPPGEEEAEGEAEEPPRDLAAELQTALAGVVSCLGVREANQGPDVLSISVSVTFVASGMATRAEATSADISEAERACVRQRALATRLQGPLEDAPRTVATAITLNRQKPPSP